MYILKCIIIYSLDLTRAEERHADEREREREIVTESDRDGIIEESHSGRD